MRTANLITLPTKDTTNLAKIDDILYYGETIFDDDETFCHLYLVCDTNMSVGDYFINKMRPDIGISRIQNKEHLDLLNIIEMQKVIATTDPSLNSLNIPTIDDVFVMEYAKKNGNIKEVRFENTTNENDVRAVNIFHIKQTYTRNEVLELCKKFYQIGLNNGSLLDWKDNAIDVESEYKKV